MPAKLLLYALVTFIVAWAMESININGIFKKNRVYQARVFYYLLGLSLVYIITNFIFDISSIINTIS